MKFRTLRLLSIPALLLTLAMSLGACNTMEGLGEDTAAAGEEIEETAEDASQ
jgi:predicted small secreted protein